MPDLSLFPPPQLWNFTQNKPLSQDVRQSVVVLSMVMLWGLLILFALHPFALYVRERLYRCLLRRRIRARLARWYGVVIPFAPASSSPPAATAAPAPALRRNTAEQEVEIG